MSLENAWEHIKQAEQELEGLLKQREEERARDSRRPMMYTFVYEQQYDDVPGWGPNQQLIEARDIEQAFSIFGRVLKEMNLRVRNIRYGAWSEMEEEVERISVYWQNYRAIKREQEKA